MKIEYKPTTPINDLKEQEYTIKEENYPTFFPGRAGAVYYCPTPKTKVEGLCRPLVPMEKQDSIVKLGIFGIVHPQVLQKFNIPVVLSCFELIIEELQ